jgi:CBS domain-containing protein
MAEKETIIDNEPGFTEQPEPVAEEASAKEEADQETAAEVVDEATEQVAAKKETFEVADEAVEPEVAKEAEPELSAQPEAEEQAEQAAATDEQAGVTEQPEPVAEEAAAKEEADQGTAEALDEAAKAETAAEETAAEEDTTEAAVEAADKVAEPEAAKEAEPELSAQPEAEEQAERAAAADEQTELAEEPAPVAEEAAVKEDSAEAPVEADETEAVEKAEAQASAQLTSEDADKDAFDNEEEAAKAAGREQRPVSDAIRNMASADGLLGLSAKDVMQKGVVWVNAEDTLEQTLTKMQQHNVGYVLVGKENNIVGLVSKSDIRAGLSPYLQNIFGKWRRPLDIATLQIKVKWIMSRPVCIVSPDLPLARVMGNMSSLGSRCMPVVGADGKVQGIITVFDIFQALLKHNLNVSSCGQAAQWPWLA